eukprot:16449375-Heterocapsa_arctica.AAC.1
MRRAECYFEEHNTQTAVSADSRLGSLGGIAQIATRYTSLCIYGMDCRRNVINVRKLYCIHTYIYIQYSDCGGRTFAGKRNVIELTVVYSLNEGRRAAGYIHTYKLVLKQQEDRGDQAQQHQALEPVVKG